MPADLAALWRRAVVLDGQRPAVVSARQIADAAAADVEAAALADALADPGPAGSYSAEGYRRIGACSAELARLRGCLAHPLTDLVAEVRRAIGVDAEALAARPAGAPGTGGEHLDRFADVVARYAERPGADAAGLLTYLDAAAAVENGLAPAEIGAGPRAGAGADGARRQGPGVADRGGTASQCPGVPVDVVQADLAQRRRRPAAAAAR